MLPRFHFQLRQLDLYRSSLKNLFETAAPIAGLFFAAHHAGSAAFRTNELPLFMRRMGLFPHLDLTAAAEHENYLISG
jgi:hypothetical protein